MIVDLDLLFSYYNKLNNSPEFVTELELRAPCICTNINDEELVVGMNTYQIISKETYTIYYYSSPINKKATYRSRSKNSALLEHKELIALTKIPDLAVTMALSTETKIMRKQIIYPIIITNESKITRYKLHNDPLLEIIYRDDNTPSIEIEFKPNQFELLQEMYLKLQSLPMWPPPSYLKPKQVSILELARKISSGSFVISAKADGIHALLYTSVLVQDFLFIVSDIGTILYSSISDIKDAMDIIDDKIKAGELLVLEVEYISDNKICVFDIAKGGTYNYWALESKTYLERIRYLSTLISNYLPQLVLKETKLLKFEKDISMSMFKSISEDFVENDGFIISNNSVLKERYKLKYNPTIDLIYKNGIFTNNRNITLNASNPNEIDLINLKVYEIEIESKVVIRVRKDKTEPNVEMPNECPSDVHKKLAKSIGIPFARVNNNKIKYRLLLYLKSKAPTTDLMDIGSGNMGDLHKWIKLGYKVVYTIDPDLNTTRLNETINLGNTRVYPYPYTAYECYNNHLLLPKKYVLSIFFVPWSDSFLSYIMSSTITAIILMEKPVNTTSTAYNLEIENRTIKLNIPNTSTATNIEEEYITIDAILSKLNRKSTDRYYKSVKIMSLDLNLIPTIERRLINMYNAYIIY